MHVVQDPATFPDLPARARRVPKMGAEANGLTYAVFDAPSFRFGFVVASPASYISGDDFGTAPQAAKAAAKWCSVYVAEPVFAPVAPGFLDALELKQASDFDAAIYGAPDLEADMAERELSTRGLSRCIAVDPPARSPLGDHEIDHWIIRVSDDRGGTYKAEVVGPDGRIAEGFFGYESPGVALSDAGIWACAHEVGAATLIDPADCEGPLVPIWQAMTSVEPELEPGHFIHDDGPEDDFDDDGPEDDFDGEVTEVAGWSIRIDQAPTRNSSAAGKFEAVVWDDTRTGSDEDGVLPDFTGYDSPEDATDAATTWAIANPTAAAVEQTDTLWSQVDAKRRPALEADMARAADRLDRDTTDLAADLARVTRERDAALAAHARDRKACSAVAVDLTWQTERKATLEARIADDKDELKGVVKRLKELATESKETLAAVGHGRQVPLFPEVTIPGAPSTVRITFDSNTRAQLQAAADTLRAPAGAATWAHNGIDYAIEARASADGWRTWIPGYEAETTGYGPEREDAERETKAMALAVLPAAGTKRRARKPKAVST